MKKKGEPIFSPSTGFSSMERYEREKFAALTHVTEKEMNPRVRGEDND